MAWMICFIMYLYILNICLCDNLTTELWFSSGCSASRFYINIKKVNVKRYHTKSLLAEQIGDSFSLLKRFWLVPINNFCLFLCLTFFFFLFSSCFFFFSCSLAGYSQSWAVQRWLLLSWKEWIFLLLVVKTQTYTYQSFYTVQ